MHPPALPRQTGGVGDAEHVSLTEILKRSTGYERTRTPIWRDPSDALFQSGVTNTTPGHGKETPTKSVAITRPPTRAAQGPVTPVRPIQSPEGILCKPPPLHCAQSTRNIATVASRETTSPRRCSVPFHHGVSFVEGASESPFENSSIPQFGNSLLGSPTMPQVPNVTNDGAQSQILGSIGVTISSRGVSMPPLRPQPPRRTLFNPPSRSVPTDPQRIRSPSPQAALVEGCGIEEVIVSHRQTAYKRPTTRTITTSGIENSADVIMDDAPPLAPESDQLVPSGRKRTLENLPTMTIKLENTKRKKLLCRHTIQRERSSEARLTAELTRVPEAGNSRQKRSAANSEVMAQGAEDLLLGERQGLGMDKAVTEIEGGFAVNRPRIFGQGGDEGDHDGQGTSEINTSVGVPGNSMSLVPDPPLGSFSAYQASGAQHSPAIVSDRTPGHKEKGKWGTNERMGNGEWGTKKTEMGSAHVIGADRVALDGCLDETESPGNSGRVTSNTSGGSTISPIPVQKRRERKKREQIKKAEGEGTKGGNTNSNPREFGPWSMEAFDLIAWRPPNLAR